MSERKKMTLLFIPIQVLLQYIPAALTPSGVCPQPTPDCLNPIYGKNVEERKDSNKTSSQRTDFKIVLLKNKYLM